MHIHDRIVRLLSPVRVATAVSLLMVVGTGLASARYEGREPIELPGDKGSSGVFALEGEFVHNVGELQINITNWGLIGSRPSQNAPYSDAPSAMWPASSGVDYLWAAGAWVGAIKNGVPLVSTGQFTPEFLANADDPLDTVYETTQGAPGGARYPSPSFNDDAATDIANPDAVNEDPIDGLDNDGDGLIDEDFAAIGNQMFRCVMRDNTALAEELFSEHDPLDVQLVQESYQWEGESVDDFVGFHFEVTNIGVTPLNEVFLGFFADCDIGPRSQGGIAEDDLTWFARAEVRALDNSIVPVDIAAMYDADGDQGQSPGFFGIMFLGHPTDPTGETAPNEVGIRSFQSFGGNQPFDKGGDPTNDAERYELLSRAEIDQTPPLYEEGKANDFRIMLAQGPWVTLDPGQTLDFQAAMVAGEGPDGLLRNAAEAALTFYGAYFDRDGDPTTGSQGRETQICEEDFGPPGPTNPIFDLFQDCADSLALASDNPPAPISPENLDDDGCVWINNDCPFEARRGAEPINFETPCLQDGVAADPTILAGCTGIEGKEFNVPWLVGLAPTPPGAQGIRLWQTDGRVHVFWDNLSEVVPDVRLQQVDFESYRIWRADGWDRPFGSRREDGPESRLWRLIAEYDIVDFFEERRTVNGVETVRELPLGANTGLDIVSYVPEQLRPGHPEQVKYADLDALVAQIVEDDPNLLPTRDPATFLRYAIDGTITPIGQAYPDIRDWDCCPAAVDTSYYDKVGLTWYEYVDRDVHNGIDYFYSVTATDFNADPSGDELVAIGPGLVGDPQSNFVSAMPRPEAQSAEERSARGHNIYVVPNPATRDALEEFSQLNPNGEDPTGVKVMFSNLPAARNTVKIYTLAGDLVQTIEQDGSSADCTPDDTGFRQCGGAAFWNLVSRNGQEIVSGIYLYSVESDDPAFDRVVGRFVVVR